MRRLALAAAFALVAGAAHAQAPVMDCQALAKVAPSRLGERSVVITNAFPSPPSNEVEHHCEISGKLQERKGANGQTYAIRFHMRLPDAWNGRFFFQGGGGSNGTVGNAMGNLLAAQPGNALRLGYAVVSQDSGHDNATNNDPKLEGVVTFGWDAEARRNYGGASIGPVTRVAKGLIRAYYGRAPQFSYYVGGSKGGQEAMMAAQRFPEEFDAVLVGYPGYRLAYAGAVGQMWDAQAFAEAARALGAVDASGLPILGRAFSDEDLAIASQAVLTACDGLDQTVDGMVENFTACTSARVMPAQAAVTCPGAKAATCLLPAQVAALRKVYEGARGPDGALLYSDWAWDAGMGGKTPTGYQQGWRGWKIGDAARNDSRAVLLGAPIVATPSTRRPWPCRTTRPPWSATPWGSTSTRPRARCG